MTKQFNILKSRKLWIPLGNMIALAASILVMFVLVDNDESLWTVLSYGATNGPSLFPYAVEMVVSTGFILVVTLIASIMALTNKKEGEVFAQALGLTLAILQITFSISNQQPVRAVFPIIAAVLFLAELVFLVVLSFKEKRDVVNEKSLEEAKKDYSFVRIADIIIAFLALIAVGSIFFFPFYYTSYDIGFSLIDALNPECDQLIVLLSFVLYFIIFLWFTLSIIQNMQNSFTAPQKFIKNVKHILYASLAITLSFYIYGVVLGRYFEGEFAAPGVYSSNGIPFLVASFFVVLEAILSARYVQSHEDEEGQKFSYSSRIVVLIFTFILDALAVITALTNILTISVTQAGMKITTTVIGYELLTQYQEMGTGFQMLAFLIFASLVTVTLFLILDLTTFFRRSRSYYKIAYIGIVVDYMIIFGLFLFGFFYTMAQKMNMENIISYLQAQGVSVNTATEYKIESSSGSMIYFALATLAIVCLVILRPFSNHLAEEAVDVNVRGIEGGLPAGNTAPTEEAEAEENTTEENPVEEGQPDEEEVVEEKLPDFDPCPAFSELDEEELARQEALHPEEKEEVQEETTEEVPVEEEQKEEEVKPTREVFENPTLPAVTKFIIDYARDSRLHLSYNAEMIATYIAGLGAAKLSILQGMSGTGKTSLPKIFTEALQGECDIVEVESSWKDKNELIGYYNEFTKLFTPKKFTQSLYHATLNKETITLIVLDEMNLSRIEYYFSDFLSLMENEEDKRTFKLVNVPLSYVKDGQRHDYLGLEKGHTLRITPNIWFIGTANRDESTFEISDKVYDRANTINFDSRAPKAIPQGEPLKPKYLSYEAFRTLLDDAKNKFRFDLETVSYIPRVEKLLEPYNISFGNRIARQMEDFVKVYCSCFEDGASRINEAMEDILLSKVVHKLEYKSVEDKDELAEEFEKLNLHRCAKFISRLSEDN